MTNIFLTDIDVGVRNGGKAFECLHMRGHAVRVVSPSSICNHLDPLKMVRMNLCLFELRLFSLISSLPCELGLDGCADYGEGDC